MRVSSPDVSNHKFTHYIFNSFSFFFNYAQRMCGEKIPDLLTALHQYPMLNTA